MVCYSEGNNSDLLFPIPELHVSAYGEHVAGEAILHFQDADGRMFANLVLTRAEKNQWLQELLHYTGA